VSVVKGDVSALLSYSSLSTFGGERNALKHGSGGGEIFRSESRENQTAKMKKKKRFQSKQVKRTFPSQDLETYSNEGATKRIKKLRDNEEKFRLKWVRRGSVKGPGGCFEQEKEGQEFYN